MWINRKEYNKIIDRYENRISDLLNRLMSKNYKEYTYVKPTAEELPEPTSRTDQDEYEIEQKRLNDIKELEEQSEKILNNIYEPLPKIMR